MSSSSRRTVTLGVVSGLALIGAVFLWFTRDNWRHKAHDAGRAQGESEAQKKEEDGGAASDAAEEKQEEDADANVVGRGSESTAEELDKGEDGGVASGVESTVESAETREGFGPFARWLVLGVIMPVVPRRELGA